MFAFAFAFAFSYTFAFLKMALYIDFYTNLCRESRAAYYRILSEEIRGIKPSLSC